jgi:pimeloyl-ACP methyl ester carboxylesterase
MPTVTLDNGSKIFYLDKGKGRNLVYIHGFLGSSWIYEALVDHFSKKYRVIALDHLGHGQSDKPETESYELPQLALYVDQALSKIIGNEKIILHGHSMGGMIALIYATTPSLAKRLEKLVLMGTAPILKNPGLVRYIEDIKAGKMKIIDREVVESVFINLCFDRKFRKNKENQSLLKEFIDKTLQNKEYVGIKTMESIVSHYNVEDKISQIKIPTLILTSDSDIFILPDESKKMHQKIPNSKLAVFSPHVGHMINYEAKNDYIKVMEEFLSSS